MEGPRVGGIKSDSWGLGHEHSAMCVICQARGGVIKLEFKLTIGFTSMKFMAI
jgi:hypothetical protein